MKITNETSIADLNDDCLLHILRYVGLEDRINLDSVCERWRYLCSYLWKKVHSFDVCTQELGHIDLFLNPEDFGEDDIDAVVCQKVFEKTYPYLKMINLSRVEFPQITILMDMWHICSYQFDSENFPAGTLNHLKDSLLKCEKLEELWLCRCVIDVDDAFLSELFAKNKNLRRLALTEYELTGECFSHLSSDILESLVLFRCVIQQPQYLNSLVSSAPNLKQLSIRCNGYGTRGTEDLLGSSDNLLGRNENGEYDVRLGLLYSICSLKNLKVLSLKISDLNDSMLKCIALKCSNLEVLDIQWCENISDVGLGYTKLMPNLKCLDFGWDLSDEVLTDSGLLALNRNLHALVIRETSFSGTALLTVLREMPNLKKLDISDCRQYNSTFIESVIDVVNRRKDRVPLEIGLYETGIEIKEIRNTCPLVKLNDLPVTNYEKYC